MKYSILLVLSMFLISCTASKSVIVTSKTEAQKKNLYTQPKGQSKVTTNSAKAENKTVAKAKLDASKAESAKKNPNKNNRFQEIEEKDIILSSSEVGYLCNQLINNAVDNLGSPYRGGGTSKAGFDCSGLVYSTFRNFEITLPRSSNSMAKYGYKIDKHQARPGDLIFFTTNGKRVINHVGIVTQINGDEILFIHSSTSLGVIISSTKENYYSRSFAQINRVVE